MLVEELIRYEFANFRIEFVNSTICEYINSFQESVNLPVGRQVRQSLHSCPYELNQSFSIFYFELWTNFH